MIAVGALSTILAGVAIVLMVAMMTGINQSGADRGSAPAPPVAPAPPAAPEWTWFERMPPEAAASWPNNPRGIGWFASGEYHMFARNPGQFVAIGAPVTQPLHDVTVHARFRKVGGPPGGGYGIIVRDAGPGRRDGGTQEGRFYVLEAGDQGEYGVWRREGNRWVDLIPWTPTAAVRPGSASNELTVVATGERLRFLINGTEVANVTDATLREGGVGIFVGGDLNEVVVERLAVQP